MWTLDFSEKRHDDSSFQKEKAGESYLVGSLDNEQGVEAPETNSAESHNQNKRPGIFFHGDNLRLDPVSIIKGLVGSNN